LRIGAIARAYTAVLSVATRQPPILQCTVDEPQVLGLPGVAGFVAKHPLDQAGEIGAFLGSRRRGGITTDSPAGR
jgi:hypothetical protein